MKKKTIALFAALLVTFAFVGCNNGNGNGSESSSSGHEHTYKTKYDETGHWTACECGDTTERQSHTIKNYFCTCGYVTQDYYTSQLEFQLNADNASYSVKKCKASKDSVYKMIIPAQYQGLPVTGISAYAFSGYSFMSSVHIPDSVTEIYEQAFSGCTSLKTVNIPAGVTYIGDQVFGLCGALEYNEYENGRYLGDENNPYVFLAWQKSSEITSCQVHEDTKFINSSAFSQNKNLAEITLPSGLVRIGSAAFYYCTQLKRITIPASVEMISSNVLFGSGVEHIVFEKGSKVKTIPFGAFGECTALKTLVIPASVTKIANYAFNDYTTLEKLYYGGTAEEWATVAVDSTNTLLDAVTMYYYAETAAEATGNSWYYNADGTVTER